METIDSIATITTSGYSCSVFTTAQIVRRKINLILAIAAINNISSSRKNCVGTFTGDDNRASAFLFIRRTFSIVALEYKVIVKFACIEFATRRISKTNFLDFTVVSDEIDYSRIIRLVVEFNAGRRIQ